MKNVKNIVMIKVITELTKAVYYPKLMCSKNGQQIVLALGPSVNSADTFTVLKLTGFAVGHEISFCFDLYNIHNPFSDYNGTVIIKNSF